MADNENNKFKTMTALTMEAIIADANMSESDKQLIDNAVTVAKAAAISAGKQIGVKTSIVLYRIGALINEEAVKQYVKERGDPNAET